MRAKIPLPRQVFPSADGAFPSAGTPNHPAAMARHKHHQAVENEQATLDISSLIDVTFLLLIYFLVTSAIQVRETDLGLRLAGTPSGETPHIDPVFIRVDGSGLVSAGNAAHPEPLDSDPAVRELPLLSQWLDLYAAAARSAGNQPLVQVYADDSAHQQRVVDVLNTLARLDIRSVTFTDL